MAAGRRARARPGRPGSIARPWALPGVAKDAPGSRWTSLGWRGASRRSREFPRSRRPRGATSTGRKVVHLTTTPRGKVIHRCGELHGVILGICQLWPSDPAFRPELQTCKLPTMWITPVEKRRQSAEPRARRIRKDATVSDQRTPGPGRASPNSSRKPAAGGGERAMGAGCGGGGGARPAARPGGRWRRRAGRWPQ